MDQFFMGIDSGTQGTKVILLNREKKKIETEAQAPHRIIENNEGRKEQDPAWWIEATSKSIKYVISKSNINPTQIKAIGISGQQHGFVPLDKNGDVIRPAKLWNDTETAEQAKKLTEKLGGRKRVINLIGNSIAAGYTASKILWLKENEPENYQKMATIMLPHDYLNFWLTGEKKMEFGDASGTAYFDVKTRKWSPEILIAIDEGGKLIDCLPELIPAHQPVGTVKKDIAESFGFNANVLVASGGGDNMMAAIGTGNVAQGVVTTSLGTSGTIFCASEKPVVDPKGELAAFCSSDGQWLPLVCTMNVTVSTELNRNLFGMDVEKLNKIILSSSPGAQGLLILPYYGGERTPALPNACATIYGINNINYKQENICRAAMEGPTFGLRYGLDIFKANGIGPNEIRLVGGGAKSKIWRKIVAEIFACPVVCPVTQEAAALGAALQAFWCYVNSNEQKTRLKDITDQYVTLDEATRVIPNRESIEMYADIYKKYLKLDKLMRPMFTQSE